MHHVQCNHIHQNMYIVQQIQYSIKFGNVQTIVVKINCMWMVVCESLSAFVCAIVRLFRCYVNYITLHSSWNRMKEVLKVCETHRSQSDSLVIERKITKNCIFFTIPLRLELWLIYRKNYIHYKQKNELINDKEDRCLAKR